ncbi:FecR family protein [Sphingobacterium athyrii]|uniref:Uncharacterized protein n=1 Tax=Sphingobacterium athyrii TaxID=2152717 RepID=A0A363NTF7_9SPHI|nr:FecR domain-containing protein [Sphingobacterium athyrii]PUV24030.1 hypothetical protein DCO56_11695 [Sphingobacterium athyrii]
MKHDKKKNQIRKTIWKMPFLVDELFKDEDWNKYETTDLEEKVPSEEMKLLVQTAIDNHEECRDRKLRLKYKTIRYLSYTAAAAILFFFSFHFITWWTKDKLLPSSSKVAVVAKPKALKDTSWTLIENKNRQSVLLDLPDGSHVRLFGQSYIRYVKDFTENVRDIELVGRAYFDIASDPKRPFSVIAAGTKTTALGTSFTINTRLKHKTVTVTLHTGKVLVSSLTNRFKQVFLDGPGQKLRVDKLGLTQVDRPGKDVIAKTSDLASADLLNLKNTPMPAVLQALETAFKKQIHLGDNNIAAIHYTGEIDVSKDNLRDILTTICLINELRFVANEDGSYTLYKQENTITEHINN